ncbi:hypothetical protein MPSEU_000924600 [Mayamaea pseudoterrestris]|nr:hypothetical protein MPSEU_000924600 [Mayamaea pseudoterrestris]
MKRRTRKGIFRGGSSKNKGPDESGAEAVMDDVEEGNEEDEEQDVAATFKSARKPTVRDHVASPASSVSTPAAASHDEDAVSIDPSAAANTNRTNMPSTYRNASSAASAANDYNTATAERPSYRMGGLNERDDIDDDDDYDEDDDFQDGGNHHNRLSQSAVKAKLIEASAGTHRLQRILNKTAAAANTSGQHDAATSSSTAMNDAHHVSNNDAYLLDSRMQQQQQLATNHQNVKRNVLQQERILSVSNVDQVSRFIARIVLPPIRVDAYSKGGQFLHANLDASTLGASMTAAMNASSNPAATAQPTMAYHLIPNMQQECLLILPCHAFESTGAQTVNLASLQYPSDWAKHKRALSLFGGTTTSASMSVHGALKRKSKMKWVVLARSTNKPLMAGTSSGMGQFLAGIYPHVGGAGNDTNDAQESTQQQQSQQQDEGTDRGYDTMFADGDDDEDNKLDISNANNLSGEGSPIVKRSKRADSAGVMNLLSGHSVDDTTQDGDSEMNTTADDDDITEATGDDNDNDENVLDQDGTAASRRQKSINTIQADEAPDDELLAPATSNDDGMDEISSFPVLVLMTLNADGTSPDVRKLIPVQDLTTIQDLHATVLQLAFVNGDTIRLEFGQSSNDESKAAEGSLDKERFVWSLLQVHAMLCVSVVERNSMDSAGRKGRMILPPLNVLNLDRAELQYVATVNGFLRKSASFRALFDRHRMLIANDEENQVLHGSNNEEEGKVDLDEMDRIAYDLIMGNFNMRISLFASEEERKDAEEILNSTEWTSSLNREETAAVSVAERLGFMLQAKMRDLEAETCRRLIAWEDEKHLSVTGDSKLFTASDERDTVDALALASLFKTLEALDTELKSMEDWLQARAAAIKPLTDDCADIEEENRQLEQQWKSYDMLQTEMKRLLQGALIDENVEKILKNPASALVYDEDGRVDVEESEPGIEEIYDAGKALQEAMEYPRRSGGLHLEAVSERADGLATIANSFCTALAHIIVTVMEQFNQEVLAGSDYGKVSKNDTHSMIAKKIRDTQRKFQSALLGYIKLIEILAALSPEMLPALRDAYSEMVAESILMKKRMKGYFQALPGNNAAYMNKAGKDLKDYIAFSEDGPGVLETVNAPDIRNAFSELLPVIAREAYFTSALFGSATKDQDGREKKRNFENTRSAVDNASQHFRYYIERTCGILPDQIGGKSTFDKGVKGDPLLCLVGSIYLNEAMDNYIDREKKGGDHSLSLAYVRATILDLRKKADKQWVGWVEKQVEWIRSSDGVPLNGKRAGIFPSFGRFPLYLDHVILACREGRDESYAPDIVNIKVINYYLQKMAAALLESLRECASRDMTDQQYASHVMQMENTYFFTQAIKQRGPMFTELFAKQTLRANAICKDSTDAYLGWMIKREFVTLHELFSKVSKLRKEVGDKQVGSHVPKPQFVRTLQKEANKDTMREKISTMFARMEKHLSEEGKLLPVAWKALVKVLYEWFGRWEKMSTQIYGHKLSPTAVDIVRIAKAAGGQAKPKTDTGAATGDFGFKSILSMNQNKQDAK